MVPQCVHGGQMTACSSQCPFHIWVLGPELQFVYPLSCSTIPEPVNILIKMPLCLWCWPFAHQAGGLPSSYIPLAHAFFILRFKSFKFCF